MVELPQLWMFLWLGENGLMSLCHPKRGAFSFFWVIKGVGGHFFQAVAVVPVLLLSESPAPNRKMTHPKGVCEALMFKAICVRPCCISLCPYALVVCPVLEDVQKWRHGEDKAQFAACGAHASSLQR
jgi:hypothetical protein